MRLVFIHRDGRAEHVPDADALQRAGGYPAYARAVIAHLLEAAPRGDLELWVTWQGSVLPPPPPGRAVLFLLGDETGQIPVHAGRFLCGFANGSRGLGSPPRVVSPGSAWIALLEGARMARNLARRLRRSLALGAAPAPPRSFYPIPLGGAGADAPSGDEEIVPFSSREWDVAFLGSVGRLRRLPVLGETPMSPKPAARLALGRTLSRAAATVTDLRILVGCADRPEFGAPLPPDAYRRALRNTKICLCPRGNFAETFRHAEAARAGCIVMTDRLPREWYLRDHPFVVIDDWTRVVPRARALLADAEATARLAQASQQWYDAACSPHAVARFMASRIAHHAGARRDDA